MISAAMPPAFSSAYAVATRRKYGWPGTGSVADVGAPGMDVASTPAVSAAIAAANRSVNSAPTARAHSLFVPDRELGDGERVLLDDPEHPVTLRAVHTPGHAANHLCLALLEDGLLFSGDHVLNGSTTVIDPPDGDMTAYLDSLDALSAACAKQGLDFILPAHGYVLGDAAGAIARGWYPSQTRSI